MKLRPIAGRNAGSGELCVRNAMVVREAADPDGWCALGDIVRRDAAGYLYLEGRLDGMINTGSYHVYPREIEEAIADLPAVRAAWVRGEPDPVWGQAVTAYIVAARDAPADLVAGVRAALERRFARYKIPKRFHLVASSRRRAARRWRLRPDCRRALRCPPPSARAARSRYRQIVTPSRPAAKPRARAGPGPGRHPDRSCSWPSRREKPRRPDAACGAPTRRCPARPTPNAPIAAN